MKYIKTFEDFNPDSMDEVNLPITIYNEILKAWLNDNENITEKDKGMINFVKNLILSVIIGDDVVWGQEERTKRVLDVMNDFNILPFDIKLPYNYIWMEAKKNGTEKLSRFWSGALKDPQVKKSIDKLTNLVNDMVKKKKEQDEFKKVNKELTSKKLDLNSFKYNEAQVIIEDTTEKHFNVGSLIQIVDDNDKNIGQAKIKKELKTIYHVNYRGENFKVSKKDLAINKHAQIQTNINNLK